MTGLFASFICLHLMHVEVSKVDISWQPTPCLRVYEDSKFNHVDTICNHRIDREVRVKSKRRNGKNSQELGS